MEDRNKGIINYRWEDWDMAGSTLDFTLVEARHDPPAVLDVSIETGLREVSRDGLAMMHDIAEQVERAGGNRPAIDATPDSKPRITVKLRWVRFPHAPAILAIAAG